MPAASFASAGSRLAVPITSELQQKLFFARIVRGEFVSTTAHVSHRQALRESRREAASGRVARALSQFTDGTDFRSEEQTSELQSLMRISYAVFCLKKKKQQ